MKNQLRLDLETRQRRKVSLEPAADWRRVRVLRKFGFSVYRAGRDFQVNGRLFCMKKFRKNADTCLRHYRHL